MQNRCASACRGEAAIANDCKLGAISLYQLCIRATYKHLAFTLYKNYAAIAAALRKLQAVFYLGIKVFLRCISIQGVLLPTTVIEGLYLVLGALT